MSKISIFWFRNDLRISDNPALSNACEEGEVIPIYVVDKSLGAASQYWLHHSLNSLDKSFAGKLNLYNDNHIDVVSNLIKKYDISGFYFNEAFDRNQRDIDNEIYALFNKKNIPIKYYNSSLLWHPKEIKNGSGEYYKVFTPYYKKGCLSGPAPRDPIQAPEKMNLIKDEASLDLDALGLLPDKDWHKKFDGIWKIGEKAAQDKLYYFIENGLEGYKEGRNFPGKSHTSLLSPHLRFGEISPNQIWSVVHVASLRAKRAASSSSSGLTRGPTLRNLIPGSESGDDAFKSGDDSFSDNDISHFLSEIGWREFSYYLLYHFEDLPTKNFQKIFDNFPWQNNPKHLDAWKKGKTGIPIVDAGMRELYQTGYMHNRLRMIVGSFLVKNLLIDWREGARHFWDCLMDADIANNSASWQWVAGSGADAAPYFRIFNPILQGEKFDPDGEYTRKYVPELAKLPNAYLFKPFQASAEILSDAKIELGKDYPYPIIDLSESRNKALELYKQIKN